MGDRGAGRKLRARGGEIEEGAWGEGEGGEAARVPASLFSLTAASKFLIDSACHPFFYLDAIFF